MGKIIKYIILILFYIKERITELWYSYFIYKDYFFDRFLNMKEEYYIYIFIFLIIFFCYLYYLYSINDIDTFTTLIFLYIYIMMSMIFVYFFYFLYLFVSNYTFIVPYYLYFLTKQTFIFDNYYQAQIFFDILSQDVPLLFDKVSLLFESEDFKIYMIKYSIVYYKIVFMFKKNDNYYIYFKVYYLLNDYIYPNFHKIDLYILKFKLKEKYGDKYLYYYFKKRDLYIKKYKKYLENKNKKFYEIFFENIKYIFYILKDFILEIIDLYKEIFLFFLETLKNIFIGEIPIFEILKMLLKAFTLCCQLFIKMIQEIFIFMKEEIFKAIIKFIKYIIKIIKDNVK